ncbi:hypothetical protein KKF81_04890 [Candidatus Micrarchaeota archaeon]|nr:hypothetical protein [Candidatus Micrarchaeota archaeon]MBU1166263.1 hypothetical protein [Candidatus Micrarchaeota archaeon]MBU1886717.1 hypothetical protein [Candidatus Micrarchaeota archaeon]
MVIQSSSKDVIKVAFLVHPGFMQPNACLVRNYDPKTIFRRYKEKAESLGSNDVLVVALQRSTKELSGMYLSGSSNTHPLPDLIHFIKELRVMMGRRVVFISNDQRIMGTQTELGCDYSAVERTSKIIKQILASRGYNMTPETIVEVFGELLELCVATTAAALHTVGFSGGEPILDRKNSTSMAEFIVLDSHYLSDSHVSL